MVVQMTGRRDCERLNGFVPYTAIFMIHLKRQAEVKVEFAWQQNSPIEQWLKCITPIIYGPNRSMRARAVRNSNLPDVNMTTVCGAIGFSLLTVPINCLGQCSRPTECRRISHPDKTCGLTTTRYQSDKPSPDNKDSNLRQLDIDPRVFVIWAGLRIYPWLLYIGSSFKCCSFTRHYGCHYGLYYHTLVY